MAVMLEGDFEESYTKADNSRVVATDTSELVFLLLLDWRKESQIIEFPSSSARYRQHAIIYTAIVLLRMRVNHASES